MRCPRSHAPTSLVLVAERTDGRDLVEGVAGCPVCYAEVTIRAGDVRYSPTGAAATSAGRAADVQGGEPNPTVASWARQPSVERVQRLQALLGLAEPGGAVLVTGAYAALAAALADVVDVAVVALNATVAAGPGRAAVWLDAPVVPFSDATFRGVALDADTPLPVVLEALRSAQPDARIVGRLPLPRPDAVRELARDDEEWVGELSGRAPQVVRITRR